MIVGGFNGKFLTDWFSIQIDPNTGKPVDITKTDTSGPNGLMTLFPFQVPTVGDANRGEVLTIDWQTMALYRLRQNQWSYVMHVKS